MCHSQGCKSSKPNGNCAGDKCSEDEVLNIYVNLHFSISVLPLCD